MSTTFELMANGQVCKTTTFAGGGHLKEYLNRDKTETVRIDENAVADVVYQFNLALGQYDEISRTTRTEPVLPTAEEQIESLKQRLAATEQSAADTSLTLQELIESLYV